AQLAFPDKTVVAIVGDGGFQMTNQELAILNDYQINVKTVIINNGSLGMVRQWQEKFHGERYSHSIFTSQPDFV
ncbi:thiamine pyrophosphate-dependent enzyme, partial [Listeria monocytogenes]